MLVEKDNICTKDNNTADEPQVEMLRKKNYHGIKKRNIKKIWYI